MKNKLLMMLGIIYFFTPFAKAKTGAQKPILSWNHSITPLPMLDLVFLDPEMKHTTFDEKSLELSFEQWQKNINIESKDLGKKSKTELRNTIYFLKHFNHILVKNYYENNISEIEGYKLPELSAQVRRTLSFLLNNLLAHPLEPEEKSLLAFQKYLIDFQNPNLRQRALNSLGNHGVHSLSDQRKRFILFGEYLTELYKNNTTSKSAVQGLNHLSPYMSKEAYILSQLYLARIKLGYHYSGKKTGNFQTSFTKHLQIISNLCNSFSNTQNSLILASILSIWSKSKDFSSDWGKLPINTACYKNLVPYLATREQIALKHWLSNNHRGAYQIYDQIAEKIAEESKQVLIQKRILKLAGYIYAQNQDILFYQGVYIKALGLVEQTQFKMQLRSELFDATRRYLKTAYQKHGDIQNLSIIVNNFLKHSSNSENSRAVSILEAKILHRKRDYENAWKAYYQLSKSTKKNSQRILDLEEAIKNYALHHGWSLAKPWAHLQEKPKKDYLTFEQLHHELLNIKSYEAPRSWDAAINLGILFLINKRAKDVYELWKPYWSKNPKIKSIAQVTGALLTKLYELQSWNLISEILDFTKENNLNPQYLEKPVPTKIYEEKAAYEIGKGALANMELLKAEQAFENLINKFKGSANYPDYLAYMIKTSNLLQKYKPLRFYLEKYIEIGRNHADYQANLLSLITLLKGMGKINETLKYAKEYVDRYPNDSKSQQQINLIIKLCKMIPKPFCTEVTKQKGFQNAILTLNSYDKLKEKIVSQKHQAKKASKNLDSDKLRKIETELTNLGKSNPMVKDTINYVWFAQIKIISDSLVKKLRSRTISTDDAVSQYENIRQTFMGICNRKRVSSCAQSFKALISLTNEMKSFLALSDNNQMLKVFTELETKLKNKMSRYLSQNITEPKVAQKILWETMKEWNFHKDPYTGVGYIQLIEYVNKPQLKG